jgi:hypothetical protein
VEAINSMILDNQRISTNKKAENLMIAQEGLAFIIHYILDVEKKAVKLISEFPNSL